MFCPLILLFSFLNKLSRSLLSVNLLVRGGSKSLDGEVVEEVVKAVSFLLVFTVYLKDRKILFFS